MTNFVPGALLLMADLAREHPKKSNEELFSIHQKMMAAYIKRMNCEKLAEDRQDAVYNAMMAGLGVSVSRDNRLKYLDALAAQADDEVAELELKYNIGPY